MRCIFGTFAVKGCWQLLMHQQQLASLPTMVAATHKSKVKLTWLQAKVQGCFPASVLEAEVKRVVQPPMATLQGSAAPT